MFKKFNYAPATKGQYYQRNKRALFNSITLNKAYEPITYINTEIGHLHHTKSKSTTMYR